MNAKPGPAVRMRSGYFSAVESKYSTEMFSNLMVHKFFDLFSYS